MTIVNTDAELTMRAANLSDLDEVFGRLNLINATFHAGAFSIVKNDETLTITITRYGFDREA